MALIMVSWDLGKMENFGIFEKREWSGRTCVFCGEKVGLIEFLC
jgi:hypothetical protein